MANTASLLSGPPRGDRPLALWRRLSILRSCISMQGIRTIGPPGVVCRVKFASHLLESQVAFWPSTLDITVGPMHHMLASEVIDARARLEGQRPLLELECLLLSLSISSAKLTASSFGSRRVTSNLVSYFGSASASQPGFKSNVLFSYNPPNRRG